MQIEKGMHGLLQAGKIVNVELETHLKPFGYHPCPRSPGLWKHKSRPISFALVVDDFAIKYVGQEHKNHLIRALASKYKATIDHFAAFHSTGTIAGAQLHWSCLSTFRDCSINYNTLPSTTHTHINLWHLAKPYNT